MAKVFKEPITVSIDVGTTKICVLVARKQYNDTLEIVGVGKSPSHGLRKGVVVDIAQTVESIKTAVQEAELISGHTIQSATIGISGAHIKSFNSDGAVPINRNEVKTSDINNVLTAARAIALPEGQQVLHVLPQYFSIDNQERVVNPLGMAGIRLEAHVHIITGSVASVQNLINCCLLAGINVEDVVLEQLASARAVLCADERELGVGVLDIGGGTTDFAIYQNDAIRHTMVLAIAGNHFTNDLAIGLQTPLSEAERVKVNYGITLIEQPSLTQLVAIKKINSSDTITVHQSEINHILRVRAQELFSLIKNEINRFHLYPMLTTGIVLTGGGSLLTGVNTIAQQTLQMPVRLGAPKTGHILPDSLDNPIYATGYGLLLHATHKHAQSFDWQTSAGVTRILGLMKSWIADFF